MVRRKTHQEYATSLIPSSPTFDDNSLEPGVSLVNFFVAKINEAKFVFKDRNGIPIKLDLNFFGVQRFVTPQRNANTVTLHRWDNPFTQDVNLPVGTYWFLATNRDPCLFYMDMGFFALGGFTQQFSELRLYDVTSTHVPSIEDKIKVRIDEVRIESGRLVVTRHLDKHYPSARTLNEVYSF